MELQQSQSSRTETTQDLIAASQRMDAVQLVAAAAAAAGLEHHGSADNEDDADDDLDDSNAADDEDFIPPENLALVTKGIYRSAFPKKRNFAYLKKLGLKSILTLVQEQIPDANQKFMADNHITLYQFGVPGNKEPFVDIPEDKMQQALTVLLDTRCHPILIHCNKGKHRTGCLVGCLRKMQRWSHTSICDEYRRFSHPKSRTLDQQFIELFDVGSVVYSHRYRPDWI